MEQLINFFVGNGVTHTLLGVCGVILITRSILVIKNPTREKTLGLTATLSMIVSIIIMSVVISNDNHHHLFPKILVIVVSFVLLYDLKKEKECFDSSKHRTDE